MSYLDDYLIYNSKIIIIFNFTCIGMNSNTRKSVVAMRLAKECKAVSGVATTDFNCLGFQPYAISWMF